MKSEAFVRDFPQKVKVEDVKTKLSCETSILQNLKVDRRCENEAFVRDFLSKSESGRCETKLSCETSFKSLETSRCANEAFVPR